MKALTTWSLAAVLALTSAGLARADDAAGPVDDEQLSALIKGLGYTEKTSTSIDGKITYHSLNLVVVNFRYVIDISLQHDGKTVYFSCPLKKVGEPEKVPAEKYLALLAKNDDMAPMFFSYSAERRQMFLNYETDNGGLTTARMQETLDKLKHLLSSTFALWDTSKWPGGPQPQPAPKASAVTTDPK
jgi:hypothetical protein